MSPKLQTIAAQPLTVEAFAPFGDVLTPKARRLDNRDLLELGYARMSDQVPPERVADFDILDYWGDIATITREPMRLGYLRSRQRPLQFSWFERHLKGTQTFIPLGGAPSVFAVAEPKDLDDPNALPDLTSMRAFVMDGRAVPASTSHRAHGTGRPSRWQTTWISSSWSARTWWTTI